MREALASNIYSPYTVGLSQLTNVAAFIMPTKIRRIRVKN